MINQDKKSEKQTGSKQGQRVPEEARKDEPSIVDPESGESIPEPVGKPKTPNNNDLKDDWDYQVDNIQEGKNYKFLIFRDFSWKWRNSKRKPGGT